MATAEDVLLGLGASHVALSHPHEDLRGLTVIDAQGHLIGEVDDLYIDQEERRSRALVVGSGGLAGLERTTRLIPVDAVVRVDERVLLGVPHTQVYAVASDPGATPTHAYERTCAAYGVRPYWERN